MISYFRGQTKPYVLILDIEHDQERLIQVAGIMFKSIGEYVYQTYKNFNYFIKQDKLSNFIKNYLQIEEEALLENGITLDEFKEVFLNEVLGDIHPDDLTIVSHGIHQDDLVLFHNGINIGIYEHECTYNMAKWILQRSTDLTLSTLAEEFGYIIYKEHDAYADVLGTCAVYSVLLKLWAEEEEYEDVRYE